MSQFLEKFLLAILASLVTYAITGQGQWKLSGWKRLAVVVGAVLLAMGASVVADRLQSNGQQTRPPGASPAASPAANGASPADSGRQRPGSSNAEEEFIKKYVARSDDSPHSEAWTILFSSPSMTDFPELYAAAESALSQKGYTIRPLFRSTLLQDSGAYEELYVGNAALLKRLSAYREGFLVGKTRSEISKNTSLEIFSAHLYIHLRVISTRRGQIVGQFTIDETGAGFSEGAALMAAEHRIAGKMKDQLTLSIPPK